MASTSMSMTGRSTATSSGCARSSRQSIRISPRSKPCMASAIDTATVEPKAAPVEAPPPEHPSAEPVLGVVERPRAPSGGERRRSLSGRVLSPLTRRIIAVNVLPLLLLAVGFLYLGKFESSLIGQEIESLRTQGEIFAAAL